MTTKKIQPKNPETTAKKTDSKTEAERKNQTLKIKGRKLARKTSNAKVH